MATARVQPALAISLPLPPSPSHASVWPMRLILHTSPVTDANRTEILGTRCGTPRRASPVVRFADADPAGEGSEWLVEKRTGSLGSRRGSPRRCRPLVSLSPECAFPSPHEASSLCQAREAVLGSRHGSPCKHRGAPSPRKTLFLEPTEDAQHSLPTNLSPASACAPACVEIASTRHLVLGSRQGTPLRRRELLRIVSADKEAISSECLNIIF